jgi:carboxymethylenebutenolidase
MSKRCCHKPYINLLKEGEGMKLLRYMFMLACISGWVVAQSATAQSATGSDLEVTSGDQAYKSYLAAPSEAGTYPGVVLIHSFRGLEEGYRTMTDQFAAQGFVVLAVGWQTFTQEPTDAVVQQLLLDSVALLQAREDVSDSIGLTGFCAGGRYTMLFLPQLKEFASGVAWYGFPYGGETQPASVLNDLSAPMLMIHGTKDEPSPIADIYKYATELDAASKFYELKVYQGEPHGFMLAEGQLREDDVAVDAFNEMVDFFKRTLQ